MGVYVPGTTPVHRASPATKFAGLLLFIILITVLPTKPWHPLAAAGGVAVLYAVAKIPLRTALRQVLPILPFMAFIGAFLWWQNGLEKLQANTKQALKLADKSRADGDNSKAVEYENAAEAFAAQLVTAEQGVEDTKTLHDQALQQAEQAKQAVERNSMKLQQQVAERSKLLSQLEQAKMQEKVAESLQSMNSLTDGSSPNLDQVREKIERRYSNALGQAELAQNSVQGRMAEVEQAGIQMAGHSRLEQIRAEMGGELESGKKPAIEQGTSSASNAANSATDYSNVDQDAVAARMRELRGER